MVAAIAVVAAAVGWVAGQRIKSPAEVAAEQEPPEPSLITVPVELRTLSQQVVVRGTIRPSDETEIQAPVVAGSTVITRLPLSAGDEVVEGDVLVEVAGRPVIALEGELPPFRNLIPGLVGPDVRQLEEALLRLDYDPGPLDDTYTAATAAAVEALYRDRGYGPPEVDESASAALDSARAGFAASEDVLAEAEQALAESGGTVPGYQREALDLAVARAEAALVEARALVGRIAAAESAQSAASAAADTASARLQQATDGTHPDTGLPPTAEELVVLESANDAAAADLADADAALEFERSSLTEPTPALHVRSAEVAVSEAKGLRSEALSPSAGSAQGQVDRARTALAGARTELAAAQAQAGAWLPAGEVVFFSALPRQINTILTEVGQEPQGTVMTVSGADTIVESGVSSADRQLIEVGAEAVLVDDDLGLSVAAVVTAIDDNPGEGGLSDDRYGMELEPVEAVPDEAVGVNLRVQIPITSSGGDVLAVPLAALSAGADGRARVEVERADGQTALVEVSTGLRAGGFVEIEALGEPVSEGDRVVVGQDLVLPGSERDGAGDSDDQPAGDSDAEPDGVSENDSEP